MSSSTPENFSSIPGIIRLTRVAGAPGASKDFVAHIRDVIGVDFLRELVEKSIIYMDHAKKKTLSATHVNLAYKQLCQRSFYSSVDDKAKGCDTFSHHENQRKDNAGTNKTKKAKKFKRASQKVREIKFYKKADNNCLHLQKLPFSRFVRYKIIDEHLEKTDVRCSRGAMNLIQEMLEVYLKFVVASTYYVSANARYNGNTQKIIRLLNRDIPTADYMGLLFRGIVKYN